EQLAMLETVPGVSAVVPIVVFPVSDTPASLPFTLAPLVFGVEMDRLVENRHAPPPPLRAGRLTPKTGSDEVLVGSQVRKALGVGLGSTLAIRGRSFTVVGLLDTTFTGPDSFVFMSFATAERLLVDSEPLLRRLVMTPGSNALPIATAAAVFWAPSDDAEA